MPTTIPTPAVVTARPAPRPAQWPLLLPDAPLPDAPLPDAPLPDAPLPDAPLLAAARLGDAGALAQLYTRHHAAVTRVARRHASPGFSAQDLVSEAFAALLRALANGNGPDDHALGYLVVSVRNLSAGHLRRASHRHAPAVAPDEALHAIADSSPGLEDGLLAAEERRDVRAALDSLQPSWRQVILLIYVEELSVTEAAQRLDITPEALRALSYRARRALRTAYLARMQAAAS